VLGSRQAECSCLARCQDQQYTGAHDLCRAAFIELVGRGKTGLGLEEDVERLVAFGGAVELAGGGPVSFLRMACLLLGAACREPAAGS